MAITLQLPRVLADLAGGEQTVSADGTTVGEAVADVAARYPALAPRLRDAEGRPYEFVVFYLNDEDIRLIGGFDAPVRPGDEVVIVPAVAGG
ncbi:MAG: MoaD/ThiS family protein [Gemmatimonadetes bacterium]|nr:MoaD/ThiS family protein [Gemmatimonadota bacterium]